MEVTLFGMTTSALFPLYFTSTPFAMSNSATAAPNGNVEFSPVVLAPPSTFCPQRKQNFAPTGNSALQFGQINVCGVTGCPQSGQKLALSGSSLPQLVHFICLSPYVFKFFLFSVPFLVYSCFLDV
jgi:hypothetical protein